MLDKDFNEYDNDYITLWSNYCVNRSAKRIHNYIEALAELGHINAINCYYLLKNNSTNNEKIDSTNNEKIDSNLTKIYETSGDNKFMVKYAHFSRLEFKTINELGDFKEEYGALTCMQDLIRDYWRLKKSLNEELKGVIDIQNYQYYDELQRFKETCAKLEKTDFIKELRETVDLGIKEYNDKASSLITKTLRLQYIFSLMIEYREFINCDINILDIKNIHRKLELALNSDPNNVVLQYLYARNLNILSRYDSINLIEKCRIRDYGDFIFSVLGARGLSKSLRHYIDNKDLDFKEAEDGTNDENDIKKLK